MILSDIDILREYESDYIHITDFDKDRLNPNSYNLRLHKELLVYSEVVLDMKLANRTTQQVIPDEGLILQPGILYLGRTVEFTRTEGFVPMLEGRSSIARLGIEVHVSAGFGDNGFTGYWTLELSVVQPVRIYAGVEICQIFYHTLRVPGSVYKGKYHQNREIQPSLLHTEFYSREIPKC